MRDIQPPFIYDSLDRGNAPQHNHDYGRYDGGEEQEARKPEVSSTVAIALIAVTSLLVVAAFIFSVLQLSTIAESNGIQAIIARIVLWILYLIPICGTAGAVYYGVHWLRNKAHRDRMLSLKDGPHYDMFRASQANYERMFETMANRMYDVAEERARQSVFQGVQTLTTDQSWQYSPNMSRQETNVDAPGPPELPMPTQIKILDGPKETLLSLKERGLICRSGKSLTIGFDEQERPVTVELDKNGAIAVAGRPRKGKTSTVRFLAAQYALMGGKIVVIDPHGNANSDALLQSIKPLESCFLLPPAIKPKDALAALKAVFEIGRERVEEEHVQDYYPICVIVDEFTAMMDGSNPNWVEVSKYIGQLLGSATRQFCKVGINVIVIGHSWKANLAGGTEFRSAIGAKIIHQTSATETKFFEVPAALAKGFDKLQVGQAMKWENGEAAFVARIPYITVEDLQTIVPVIPKALPLIRQHDAAQQKLAELLSQDV